MSISELLINANKPWMDIRVNNMTSDGTITASNLTVTDNFTINDFNVANLAVTNIIAISAVLNVVKFTIPTVAQQTNISAGVTINGEVGLITTVTTTGIDAHNSASFIVTNNKVLSTDVILVNIQKVSGAGLIGNIIPSLLVTEIANGSFRIYIMNAGNSAFNNSLIISFMLIHANV